MNGRVAELVSRYWHRQGYRVEVGAKEGPVWSNLRCGLPPGYRGQDAMPLASVALGIATRIKRGAGQSRIRMLGVPPDRRFFVGLDIHAIELARTLCDEDCQPPRG